MKRLFALVFAFVIVAVPTFAKESEYEKLKIFAKVMAIIEHDYVDNVSQTKLINDAIKGMVSSLDPHSSYMTKDEYKELKITTTGKFGGLGMVVTMKDGILTVVSPIEDTPAFKAGIKAGDKIIKINGESTFGMTLEQCVKLLRGKPGTKVTITIIREGKQKPFDVTITRAIIHVKSVKYKKYGDIGYVRITQFQDGTTSELKKALKKLGKIKGLVIDLRNDPGGLLREAIGVCDLFIKKGVIVSIRGRNKSDSRYFYAHDDGNEPNYPIVVLINSGTASAAEIVSGCLKDHKRAIIMGVRSFGKGSVQSIIPLGDGSALRLTTAKYYTPSGKSIQAVGIEPDIVVHQAKIIEEESNFTIRESNLLHHLNNPTGQKVKKETDLQKELKDDYQLLRAIELIKAEDIICSRKSH
ncbi:S41 family peptidase [Hippea alviniae]|uniref:S41 family peptidase n=1 Tax=Hippea alviniae TaxID=1279027 RepID=UPI0003B7758B|nr:S41 family peptidase [Hippea alviniae]